MPGTPSKHNIGEQNTIEEGTDFTKRSILKVVNLDEKLKNSYPEGFFEVSKKKKSHRKSAIKKSAEKSKSKSKTVSSKKKSVSKSPEKGKPSSKKMTKVSTMKQKTTNRKKADEASASKAKIRRSVSMNKTIQ